MRHLYLCLGLLTLATSAHAERVNLKPSARVCDAAACFPLSQRAVSVKVWQRLSNGGIQFEWHGDMLSAETTSLDAEAQDCDWGTYKGRRTYLCDGYPAEARPLEEARPARTHRPTAAVAEALQAYGLYEKNYPAPRVR